MMRRLGLCLSLSLLTFSGSDARSTRALTLTDKDFDTTTSADKLLVFSAVTSTQLPVSLGGEIGRDGEGEGTSRDERKKPYVLPPSPADLLRPDKFQFYTYNERGDMITRQMTEKEIQSLIAAGGGSHLPMDLHEPQKASDDALLTGGKKVADVVQKVQNLLKSAMDKKPSVITTSSSTISKIPEHATDEWSSILPSILSGEKLEPKPQYKPVVTSTESSLVTEEAAAMIPVVVISADEKLDHREDDPVFQKVNVIPAETTVNYDSSTTTFQKSSTLSTTLLTSTLKPTVLQSVETLSTELAGSLTSMISQVSEAVPPTLSIGQMPGIERNKLGTVDPSTTTIKTTVATADPTVTTVTANLSSVINKIIEESPVQNSTVLIEQVTLPNQAVYSVPVQHLASSLIAGFESTTNKPSLEVKAAPSKAEESSTTNINEFSTTLVPSTTTDDDEFSTEDIRTDPSFTTQPEKMVTISPFTEKTSTILIQTERIVTVTPLVENTSTILTYTKEEDDAEKEEDKETYGSTQSDGFTTLDYEAIDTTTALPFVSNKSSESTDRTTTAVENVTTSEVTRDSTESTTTSDETTTILVTRLTTSSLNHTETSTAIASKLNDTSVVDSETTEDANSTSTSTKLSKPETPVVRLDISPESSIIGELPAKIQLTDLPIVQPKIKLKKENVTKVSEQVDDRWTLVTKNAESDGKKKQQQQQQQVALDASHSVSGLDASLENTSKDIVNFGKLCNELAFGYWLATNKGLSTARSLALSPFGMTSLLAMIYLGARGSTSDQMNDLLRLDDVATFNPHLVFQNVTDTVGLARNQGIANAAFVRLLFADKAKVRKLMPFYKDQVQQFYEGLVAEVNFATISDLVRRRTNLLIRKQTGGRIKDFVKSNTVPLRSPLAALSANVFQTECNSSYASSDGRNGELYFAVSNSLPASSSSLSNRQRKLVPVPATTWRSNVLAGYEPSLDATGVALGDVTKLTSTIFLIPGQQGHTAPGDTLDRLEQRLVKTAFRNGEQGSWDKLLKVLIPRPQLQLQIPKFSHRSVINATAALKRMGLDDLFTKQADLKGINGIGNSLHLADVLQMNLFSTCGDENMANGRHHVEIYPSSPLRNARFAEEEEEEEEEEGGLGESWNGGFVENTVERTERQLDEEKPRLKLDRPFLYFVRHNPTGLILHMGRFNPRLLP